jgi:hypothetical protein
MTWPTRSSEIRHGRKFSSTERAESPPANPTYCTQAYSALIKSALIELALRKERISMNRIVRTVILALSVVVPIVVLTTICAPPAYGQVDVTVSFAPPALPVYDMPPCPEDGYLWTPGYWAYDADDGYYWVPGTWVMAPEPGLLWTPAWWGWENGGYAFHDGYWAPEVGFYGGINYGFGYFGDGFVGGGWQGNSFRYNTAVLTVDTTIVHNTYVDRTVIVQRDNDNHVSYNGGEGGISRRPTPQEEKVSQERHVPPPAAQKEHIDNARSNPDMRATQNQGKPTIAATPKPGQFNGHGVEQSKEAGAPYHAPANAPAGNARQDSHPGEPAGAPANNANENHNAPGNAAGNGSGHETGNGSANPSGHAGDLQPHQPTPPNTGNPKLDQKYQQQQQKLVDKQNQDHQKLQQQQQQEHNKAQQQNYSQQQNQQMEQKHQQQTQQMEQRHTQQTQKLQTRQAPAPKSPSSKPPKQ